MNLGILVLVAALILFGLLAFKQINALIPGTIGNHLRNRLLRSADS